MDTSTVDWWARGVGAAALLVAIASFIWNVYLTWWRDRARLKITVNPGVMGDTLGGAATYLGIEAANVGRRAITLSGMGFGFKSRFQFSHPVANEFPLKLDEGESHKKRFKVRHLKQAVVENPHIGDPDIAWVRDATGKIHEQKLSQADKTFFVPEVTQQ